MNKSQFLYFFLTSDKLSPTVRVTRKELLQLSAQHKGELLAAVVYDIAADKTSVIISHMLSDLLDRFSGAVDMREMSASTHPEETDGIIKKLHKYMQNKTPILDDGVYSDSPYTKDTILTFSNYGAKARETLGEYAVRFQKLGSLVGLIKESFTEPFIMRRVDDDKEYIWWPDNEGWEDLHIPEKGAYLEIKGLRVRSPATMYAIKAPHEAYSAIKYALADQGTRYRLYDNCVSIPGFPPMYSIICQILGDRMMELNIKEPKDDVMLLTFFPSTLSTREQKEAAKIIAKAVKETKEKQND